MFEFKFLIVTDPKNDWIFQKIKAIQNIMCLSPHIDEVQFDVELRANLVPEVTDNGRITSDWFQRELADDAAMKGYLGVIFLCNNTDGEKWKLDDGYRGMYTRDNDEIMECWVRSDRTQMVRYTDGSKRDRASKVIAHEIAHGLHEFGYTDMQIHDYDYLNTINNIEGFYRKLRIAPTKRTNLTLTLFTLKRMYKLLVAKKGGWYDAILPIPREYWDNPSQEYGNPNAAYPKTERHIGIDFPCPLRTPIRARMNGKVTAVGFSDVLGYFCHFEYIKDDKQYVDRYLHLAEKPIFKEYTQGDIIAYSGDTGDSTGPHVHLDTWKDRVDLANIDSSNWNVLTVNPKLIM